MKRQLPIFIALGFLVFVSVLVNTSSLFSPQTVNPQPTPVLSKTDEVSNIARVKIVFDNGTEIYSDFELTQNETAFSMLERLSKKHNLKLAIENYDFGVFVKEISGFESGAEMSWIYFVNGRSGNVSAENYKVQSGDIVEWKYIKPQF